MSGELPADAQIIYRVGDGKAFMSAEYEIKAPAPKQSDSFSFLFVSDPQSVTEEDYESCLLYTSKAPSSGMWKTVIPTAR